MNILISEIRMKTASDEGIDKLLALIIDFAKITPDNQQAAFLGNATPLQLRQIMAGGVSLGGATIAEKFPPALDYLDAIADFITDGGKLKIDLEARSPLTAQDIDNLSQDIAADPDKFEDSFKLNVVHETAE